jgi:hypothetical protein
LKALTDEYIIEPVGIFYTLLIKPDILQIRYERSRIIQLRIIHKNFNTEKTGFLPF